MQSLLRQACGTIEFSILATYIAVFARLMLLGCVAVLDPQPSGITVVWTMIHVVPLFTRALAVLYCAFQATAVTTACSNAVQLVNSLCIQDCF